MPLAPNMNPFITCAVTGSGSSQERSPHVPRSPEQIANSAIDAAKAGAAIVHCHVRDPDTGAPSRSLKLYREVTDRIRDSETDVILNFTAGMGGDMVFGDPENPLPLNMASTDMAGATERVAHVAECLPEICTLDCGTMNFAEADYVMTNTPGMLRAMGQMMTDLGVRPEIEVFETGHLWFAKQLVEEGIIEDPVMIQMCMGIPWGAPNDLNTFMAMVNNTPANWTHSAFSIGRHEMPYVAAAMLAGGNIRVGLEDNLWLEKGVLATNAQLVEKAATIATSMGATLMTPAEVREKLQLKKRAPVAK
ncbi:MAG: hypothetical protein ACI9CO_001127 [Candidatus Azotimanducaceae bacterium]|jgi:uncharacterized protein (DUF849 family)